MRFYFPVFTLSLFVLAGCGSGTVSGVSSVPPSGVAFSGKVQADQTAMSGASVQLYAAGTAGNGSPPTPLLANPITTDANGAFSVSADYTCPSSTSMLYVVSKGGKPVSAASANTAAWLMAAVGPCGATTTANTSIVVNEATTIVSVWALSPFLSAGGNVGASSTNAQGLANAFATAINLVNLTTGTSPGAALPSNVTIATAKLNTLANALASCAGLSSGSACSTLFSAAAAGGVAPSNTLDAALYISRNPAANTAALYALANANAAFLPALSAAPPDWLLYATITGGGLNDPAAVAIDSSGNVWVSNYYEVLSEFSPNGSPVFASGLSGYGINQSYGMTLDADNDIWLANEQTSMNSGDGDITKLNPSGEPLSGSSGFTGGGVFFPIGIAADTNGDIWVVDYGDHRVTLLNNSGTALSGSGFAQGSVVFPIAVAVDSNHTAWVSNEAVDYVTKISSDGSQVSNITCCDSPDGIAVDQGNNVWVANYGGASVSFISNTASSTPTIQTFTGGGLDAPNGIAVDGAGTVWITNHHGNSLSALAIDTATSPGTFLSPNGFGNDAALNNPYAVAIDASGSVWVSNAGANTVTEFFGAAVPVKTPLVGPPQIP